MGNKTVDLAVADLVDLASRGRGKEDRLLCKAFLESAMIAAVATIKTILGNDWTDPGSDEDWTKTAAEAEKFSLPEGLSDEQIGKLYNAICKGNAAEALAKTLPVQIKLQPELKAEVDKILGPSVSGIHEPKLPSLEPEKPMPELPLGKKEAPAEDVGVTEDKPWSSSDGDELSGATRDTIPAKPKMPGNTKDDVFKAATPFSESGVGIPGQEQRKI